jgi:2,4-dienoyl-CoA reductase (NADPH2)
MAMKPQHAALFEPLKLGPVTLRNRVFQAPLSVCYADHDGFVTRQMAEHYGRRAQGGTGMVIVENIAVNEAGRQLPRQALIAGEEHLPGLRVLAEEIKRHGAAAVVQIVHAGRYAGPWDRYEERRRLAPSAVTFPLPPDRTVTPQEITPAEIEESIAAFVNATRLAKEAGFDGVEIHGAQGFLISSFQSPRMNKRTDGYGEDPNRLALEVVDAVVKEAAGELMVGYHLFADELIDGGWSLEDACAFVRHLEGRGIDFVMPILATFETLRHPSNEGLTSRVRFQHHAAVRLQREVSIPVLTNGKLGDPDVAAQIVADGESPAVGLGRPLLTDPDWVNKVREGRGDDIRTCECSPPLCLQTQLTGTVCAHWPDEAREAGYLGYED